MSQHFVSPDGLEKLKQELAEREADRKNISERIGVAKEQGDLSENFEYHAAKEEQGQNESRIHDLKQLLKDAIVVEDTKGGTSVSLGTKFTAKLPTGMEKQFQLVGATETDPVQGKISNESPLGEAFHGAKPGDEIAVNTPSGEMNYKVISIDS